MTVADGSGEAAALDDHAVALDVAHRAGEMLVDLIHSPDLDRRWGGLEYEGDARAHRFIMSELRRMRPDDAILSEEGADDRSRVGKERVWIVDPLDGSSDYGYSPHWSVHVALVVDGEPTVGAVAVPGWETTWGTDPAPQRVPAGVESRGGAPHRRIPVTQPVRRQSAAGRTRRRHLHRGLRRREGDGGRAR